MLLDCSSVVSTKFHDHKEREKKNETVPWNKWPNVSIGLFWKWSVYEWRLCLQCKSQPKRDVKQTFFVFVCFFLLSSHFLFLLFKDTWFGVACDFRKREKPEGERERGRGGRKSHISLFVMHFLEFYTSKTLCPGEPYTVYWAHPNANPLYAKRE